MARPFNVAPLRKPVNVASNAQIYFHTGARQLGAVTNGTSWPDVRDLFRRFTNIKFSWSLSKTDCRWIYDWISMNRLQPHCDGLRRTGVGVFYVNRNKPIQPVS